jgi:ribulose-5-phosphate 4-epimerase/fuculose-1-phosphate aldolase
MVFSLIQNDSVPLRDAVAEMLVDRFLRDGHILSPDAGAAEVVLNLTGDDHPRFFRRRSKFVNVISIALGENRNGTMRSSCYTNLVASLSNLFVTIVPLNGHGAASRPDECEVYFTTPEAGYYHVPCDPRAVYERILPIATSHFATDNAFAENLPARFLESAPVVDQIAAYGKRLDALGVLPVPFPLEDFLGEEQMRHLYRIFGITGASYGNLSAREDEPALGDSIFWMTGRGVDKSNLARIGKDILLVTGFDFETGTAMVSMPAGYDPRARVSVDAVEHALVYRAYPGVGAIVHVHAWMKDILSTRQNYPCGTRELAGEVVALLARTPDPCRAVVGLKNHGLTITGRSLADIFERIEGRLLTQVEMAD